MFTDNIKILLVGEFPQYGNGTSFVRAFRKLGCNVEIIEIRNYYRFRIANRILNWFVSPPFYFNVKPLNHNIIKKILEFKPSLMLFCKPVFILPGTLLKLKEQGLILFSWYPDDIFNPKNSSSFFYKSIPYYDCHFSDKSFNITELLKKEAKKAIFLPLAADLELHFPVNVSTEEKRRIGADIVFVGNYEKERAKTIERLCRLGYSIKIYGNKWERYMGGFCLRQKRSIIFRPVYGEEMSRVFSSSKIVLAFLRKANRDLQTARTYEIPACKSFMLHERSSEAALLYKEGEEAEFFDSFGELKSKVDFYLQNEDLRNQIAKAGYERVLKSNYTYEERAKKILEIYEKLRK